MAPNPNYSPYLQYAPTFRWGGREYGEGDLAAFVKRIGGPKKYDKWARRHRVAAKSFDPVEGQVYSQFQPVVTGIEAEKKKRAEYYDHMMRNLAGFTTALGPMLGGIGPAIGGAYSDAANAIGAAGSGYGAQMNMEQAANAVAVNDTLSNIHAPEGQMLQGGDAGGVLAGLAGWIPKEMLGKQGSAYAAAAGQLPKSAAIESQLMMKGIIDKAMEEEGDYSTSIQEMIQKIPGFRSDIKSASQANALKQKEFALKQLDAERSWYLDQAKLAFLAGDKKRQNQYLALAKQQENRMRWESMGRDAAGNVAPGYHVDPRTGQVIENGWKYNAKGVPVKVGGGSSSSGKPPAVEYIGKIDQSADNIQADIAAASSADSGAFDPRKPAEAQKPKYAKLFNQLFASYKHLAKGNPKAIAYLKQLIRGKLIAAGIKPGTGG